jgi:uncharacterized protein (TIGR02453 family)
LSFDFFIPNLARIMLERSTLDFLRDLRANNNREWFAANKDRYQAEKEKFENFVGELIQEFSAVDDRLRVLQPKDCTFRIHRDTRFSQNKDPYKTNMGASFNSKGKKIHAPGMYIHCEPNEIFFGGGIYLPEKDMLFAIRKEISEFGDDVQAILDKPEFAKYYGGLERALALKKAPKGFDSAHKHVELLKLTSFIATRSFSDDEATSKNFIREIRRGAEILKPFLDMLEYALETEK